MAIICILTGVLELLTLVTVTGVLITFLALFNLLELVLMAANPICLYLIRQTGNLFTYSIRLAIWKIQQVSQKMCPGFDNQSVENTVIGTIEPLSADTDINLPASLAPSFNSEDDNNDNENSNKRFEISHVTSDVSNEIPNTNSEIPSASEIQN